MENVKNRNYNPEDRDLNKRQQVTNRDNAVINEQKEEESGTASNRNDQYNAGDTNRITGTTSISDTRNARETKSTRVYEDDATDKDNVMGSENQFETENFVQNDDDFLKDHGNKSLKNNK